MIILSLMKEYLMQHQRFAFIEVFDLRHIDVTLTHTSQCNLTENAGSSIPCVTNMPALEQVHFLTN